jgi:fatty acid amide hydrolase
MTQTPSATQIELIGLSASEMARQIAAGSLSSAELVAAHVRRIEAVNPALNAVVVRRFEEALAEAVAADQARARGEPLGPLHGVPVTIKECFHVAGTPATEGVSRYAGEIHSADNPLVRRLRRAGAIVLGKTNVPQLMLMHETDNPLYGRTQNPWDLERTPGGSSGGEAAIIAAGGSPLGLGNDLGGSIRVPAHACGICGIKPTTLRLTNALVRDNLHGMEAIRSQSGPLARTVQDLALTLAILNGPVPGEWDADVAPVALGDPAAVRVGKLRIGMWTDDGYFSASPAVRRAVHEAADALGHSGAEVEPFHPPDIGRAVELFFGCTSADGAADAKRILGDSPRDWRMRKLIVLCGLPALVRLGLAGLLRIMGQRRTAQLLALIGARSADRYWQLSAARAAYAESFFNAWRAARLDAVICPPYPLPAIRHGGAEHLTLVASYSYWANVLGVPAGVVPVTRVRTGEETDRTVGRDIVDRAAQAVELGSAGLPIGVQVAALPWREDVVLAVMSALESRLGQRADFPRTPITPPAAGGPSGPGRLAQ